MTRWLLGLLGTGMAFADPVLLLSGELLKPGQFALDAFYQSFEYQRRYDSGASPSDFPAGETRRLTRIPLWMRYGLPGGEELVVTTGYVDAFHRSSTAYLSKAGLTDTLILARSFSNLWGDLRGGLGLGVKIPTGRSMFDVGANEFPTGEGGWEGAASFAWADRRSTLIWHAEITYFLGFPRTASSVMGQSLTGEVRFGFTHRVQWGVGVEIKISDALNLMGELTANNRFAPSGTYTGNGADASGEIAAKATPEFGMEQQDHYWAGPFVQFQGSSAVRFSGGALFPLRLTNGFGGTAYVVHLGTRF